MQLTTEWQQFGTYSYRYSSSYGYLDFYYYVRYADISGSSNKKIQVYTKVVSAKNYRLSGCPVYWTLNNANQQSDSFSFKNAWDGNSWSTGTYEWEVSYDASGAWSGTVQGWVQGTGSDYVYDSSDNRSYFTITKSNSQKSADISLPDLPKYQVKCECNPFSGGTVTGGGTDIVQGTSITVTASPNTLYDFVNWTDKNSGDQISTNISYTFTVTADIILVANFKMKSIRKYIIAT